MAKRAERATNVAAARPSASAPGEYRASSTTPTKPILDFARQRQNLITRMSMRRFTRLTNAFSKKIDAHGTRLPGALLRVLQLHPDPQDASAHAGYGSGLTDQLWNMEDIVALIDARESATKSAAPIKRRRRRLRIQSEALSRGRL